MSMLNPLEIIAQLSTMSGDTGSQLDTIIEAKAVEISNASVAKLEDTLQSLTSMGLKAEDYIMRHSSIERDRRNRLRNDAIALKNDAAAYAEIHLQEMRALEREKLQLEIEALRRRSKPQHPAPKPQAPAAPAPKPQAPGGPVPPPVPAPPTATP